MNISKFKFTFKLLNILANIWLALLIFTNLFFITRDGWTRHITFEEKVMTVINEIVFIGVVALFVNLSLNVFKIFSNAQEVNYKYNNKEEENDEF